MAKNSSKCPYEVCQLPESNQRFVWQLVYILFGIACLIKDEVNFSYFPLFTFVAPVLIDLLGNKIDRNPAKLLRWGFIAINTVVVLMCGCGWYGLFEDTGSAFVVTDNAMICAGASIPKIWILWVIVSDVFVPIMYGMASPCRKKGKMVSVAAMAVKR